MQNLTTEMFIDLSKDWYYVHGHNTASKWFEVVIFAKRVNEAREKAKSWIKENSIVECHYYRNNYKPESRALVRSGKVIK